MIRAIYDVHSGHLVQSHERYCDRIGNVPVFGSGKSPGNQQRRFHGTGMMCQFSGQCCSNSKCKGCKIIQAGFRTSLAGSTTGTKFGDGVYSSATSSKSFDYPLQLSQNEMKVMFVVGVAAGVVQHATSQTFSGQPAPGKHSVVADSNHTPGINYDELIVYKDGAILPKYLILFR